MRPRTVVGTCRYRAALLLGAGGHRLHHAVEVEAARLLARRELLEALDPLPDASGGRREFVPVLARAAIAVGIAGLFMETHPEPEKALSDGPNAWPLGQIERLLTTLKDIDSTVKRHLATEN